MFWNFGKSLAKRTKFSSDVRASWALFSLIVFLFTFGASPTAAVAGSGIGCETDSTWDSPSNPECVLEFPAETRVLSGIRFQYYIANCPTSFGAGKDGPVYIKFSGVKPDGLLEAGKTYAVEAWFGHDCRDFAGAYDLDVFLENESGDKVQLEYKNERYYSYKSSRVSSVGLNYCLMYSCGNTYFNLSLTVPRKMTLGAASIKARAHTDPLTNTYGFGSVDSTFNYPNVFTVIAASTPEPLITPSPSPTASEPNVLDSTGATTSSPKKFQNCQALWKKYPGGVATKIGSKNKGTKTFKKPTVSPSVYSFNKKLDRDKDGIVCER